MKLASEGPSEDEIARVTGRSPHTSTLSSRYTERLAEAAIEPSVGSVGDRYDNALAEMIIGCTRRSSSAGADRGRASTTSSTARSSGRIGSTTADCWSRSATSHPPSPRRPTTERRARHRDRLFVSALSRVLPRDRCRRSCSGRRRFFAGTASWCAGSGPTAIDRSAADLRSRLCNVVG
jgi:hypothetical protein